MQTGFVVTVPLKEIVKLVPGVLAVIAEPPTRVASVLLHVADPGAVVSSVHRKMRLFAVTAVVFTISVGLTPVGIAAAPAGAAPHTAGLAALEQFVVVAIRGYLRTPVNVGLARGAKSAVLDP